MNSWILIKRILTWWMQRKLKTVVATGIGNAMEWFDFGVYAYTTAYIGANFFSPVENADIRQMLTFAALAIAFLLRPIGGVVFGIIGDKYGRKVVLTSTIILMAFSTLTIDYCQAMIKLDFGHQYYYCLQEYCKDFQQVESMRGNDICCRIISR